MFARSCSASSFTVTRFIKATSLPSRTVVQPGSTWQAPISRPVSSNSSRPTLSARSSMPAEVISFGSGIPPGKTHRPAAGRHLTKQKGTIGRLQRSGGDDIDHADCGTTPIAPGQVACIVGLEARPTQNAILPRVAMQQQSAAVPQSWPFALPGGEMAVDVRAARLRERPGPWLDGDLDRIKRGNFNRPQ